MKKLFLILSLFLSFAAARAQGLNLLPQGNEIQAAFEQGDYYGAILFLEDLKVEGKLESIRLYWLGVNHLEMQDYSNATRYFRQAIDRKNPLKLTYYQLGRSLLAENNLRGAFEHFKFCYQRNIKKLHSAFYMATLLEMLRDYAAAEKGFRQIYESPDADDDLKQSAMFHRGKLLLKMAERSAPREQLEKLGFDPYNRRYVPALFTKALKINPNSEVAQAIRAEISQLKEKYFLGAYKNGRPISRKKHRIRFEQRMGFDTNAQLLGEDNVEPSTEKSSFVSWTRLLGRTRFDFDRRFAVLPEIRTEFRHHFNRDNPDVYQYDGYSFTPAVRSRIEHRLFNKPAATLLEFEAHQQYRDFEGQKSIQNYERSYTGIIGERFHLFDGDAFIKFKYKDTSYTESLSALDSDTSGLSFSLIEFSPGGKILFYLLAFESNRFKETTLDYDSYLFRVDYFDLAFYRRFELQAALAIGSTDTKAQKTTRGQEFSVNPSAEIRHPLGNFATLGLGYSFTKTFSKDKVNFAYNRHEIYAELAAFY